jgi:hypothetical protein
MLHPEFGSWVKESEKQFIACLILRIKPSALLCGQVGDVMEPNLQKDFSLTHSLAVVRGTGNTEKEHPNFLCL